MTRAKAKEQRKLCLSMRVARGLRGGGHTVQWFRRSKSDGTGVADALARHVRRTSLIGMLFDVDRIAAIYSDWSNGDKCWSKINEIAFRWLR